jgi:hypothetical protein
MINLDPAKIPRLWDLLPAFMPGLFLEISVLIARPQLVYEMTDGARLDRYASATIAVILAFIVGIPFMFRVGLLRYALGLVYVSGRKLWRKFLEYLLRAKDSPSKPPRFASSRFVNEAYRKTLAGDLEATGTALPKAISELLRRRYGLKAPDPMHTAEWQAWYGVLGTPKPEVFKGILLVMATQATGWSALAAAYLAPALRSRPYFVFSLFLIAHGILFDWAVVRRWNHPVLRSLLSLRAVLDEIPRPPVENAKKEDGDAAE